MASFYYKFLDFILFVHSYCGPWPALSACPCRPYILARQERSLPLEQRAVAGHGSDDEIEEGADMGDLPQVAPRQDPDLALQWGERRHDPAQPDLAIAEETGQRRHADAVACGAHLVKKAIAPVDHGIGNGVIAK
jgi:hypothetical protein